MRREIHGKMRNETKPFFGRSDFKNIHAQAKESALSQVSWYLYEI